MQVIVKMLIAFCVVFNISGCTHKLIVVPKQCVIPTTDEPKLALVDVNTTLGEAKRCVYNYTQVKEKYEMLKKAVEVCR
jgi:hypothetical protein